MVSQLPKGIAAPIGRLVKVRQRDARHGKHRHDHCKRKVEPFDVGQTLEAADSPFRPRLALAAHKTEGRFHVLTTEECENGTSDSSWDMPYRKSNKRSLTKAMKDHKADVGDSWVADEMQVNVGGEKIWNWNVMDEKTRYVLASHLSRTPTAGSMRKVINEALAAANSPPKTIKTDKLRSYSAAMGDHPNIKHTQSQGMRSELNNNLSERLQGTHRARIKTMR